MPDTARGGGCIYFLHFTYKHTYTHTNRFRSSMCIPPHFLLLRSCFSLVLTQHPVLPRDSAFCYHTGPALCAHSHTRTQKLSALWLAFSLCGDMNCLSIQHQPSAALAASTLQGSGARNICVNRKKTWGQGAGQVWGLLYSAALNVLRFFPCISVMHLHIPNDGKQSTLKNNKICRYESISVKHDSSEEIFQMGCLKIITELQSAKKYREIRVLVVSNACIYRSTFGALSGHLKICTAVHWPSTNEAVIRAFKE